MKRFAWILLAGVILLLIFGCSQPQEDVPTIEKLAQELTKALKNFPTRPTEIESYVKTLATDPDVLSKKSEYMNDLKTTFQSLGTDVELLQVKEFTSKGLIYSYDLGMKPDSVEKVYIMTLLFKDQSQQRQNVYTLPFITLKGESNKIYLAVIFRRDDTIIVYPKPIN